MRCLLLASILLLSCHVYPTLATGSHPITTFIDAKWNVTPTALEISEFLADENPTYYWEFIEKLNSLKTVISQLESDAKQYKTAIKIARKILGDAQVELLKLSLSLRSYSPRIQAHQQIALDTLTIGGGDCAKSDVFVVIGTSQVLCDYSQVEKALAGGAKTDVEVEVFNFDQIFPGSEINPLSVTLYSQLGTESSKRYHQLLKEHALNGKIKYINRHYVHNQNTGHRVRLSGYGVELHMKSTEYKSQDDSPRQPDEDLPTMNESTETEVNGFDFKVLKQRYPNLEKFLDRYRLQMLERTEEIAPLKAWQFQELGLQAGQQIVNIQGDDSLHIMQHLAQNFPTQAKTLLSVRVNDEFKAEMMHNIEVLGNKLNLQPPDSALFVNGLFFDTDTLDTETLLDTLKVEQRSMAALHDIGVSQAFAKPLLNLDFNAAAKEFALDIRDSAVIWINDIETDEQYNRWPSSVMDLLRPTFPGMLRSIRKNLFNLVLVVDPIQASGRQIIKLAESFVLHSAPVRLGFVMDFRDQNPSNKAAYDAILFAFNYVMQTKNARDALGFLTDIYSSISGDDPVTVDLIRATLLKVDTTLDKKLANEIIGPDSDYDYGRQLANEFVSRLGSSTAANPTALLNGVPITDSLSSSDDFEEAVLTEIMQQTPVLQKAVYKGELTNSHNVLDYLMGQSHVMPRLNAVILNTADATYLDFSGKEAKDLSNVKLLASLSNSDMIATLVPNLGYFHTKNSFDKLGNSNLHFLTLWIVADLNTNTGLRMFRNAIDFARDTKGVRVAFLPNSESSAPAPDQNLNNLVWSASQQLPGHEALDAIIEALDGKKTNLKNLVKSTLSSSSLHLKMIRVFCQRVLKMANQRHAVVVNGRVLNTVDESDIFSVDDFGLMDRFANFQYGDKIKTVLRESSIEEDVINNSDTVMRLISILVPRQNTKSRFNIPKELREEHSVLHLEPKKRDMPQFDVVAVLDPASRAAQKLTPILILLRNILNCNMRVFISAIDKHSDLPVKNFYRFVIEPELQFTKEGKMEKGPIAKFTGLPSSSLLTQALNIPDNWMVEIVNSVYDLDNIKLSDINGPVHSHYELEYLLLEGHCFDATSGSPPRGLQFTLGTNIKPVVVDTIVMANLGYFQLKANPGIWLLKLRHGKSADIYDVSKVEGKNVIQRGDESRVVISSFKSNVIKVKVTRKPDQLTADLLSDDSDQGNGGIWDSIKNSFPGGGTEDGGDEEQEVINIFSVASGHLYERLLRIMMLSTLKHTKSPVKFWFLKNYLSPQFVDFLPHMAKEYKFQYELVQYKWPRWLHQQSEKQRIIWGYKILFLDVLFPLDVKKIIFVDADAIVRTDLKELNNLDLGGAPYAYTPFCDSEKAMEGFRFWKQGYWRNHLQGRKYHISALYVVDLKRFRKVAAGDRLRGQYQALSQDPNSLSNLDQDLPNNMIHQVSIKTLPQEWLYCETWCSRDGLKNAKVIDLCNNPQTKEAKLTAAQRIVPEWTDYDSEIKQLMMRIDSELHEHVVRSTVQEPEKHDEL